MDAVRRNQYRLLQLLLKLQSNLSERDLNSALVCAVKCEYINCVGVLLDAGACPNTLDARGNTVLCLACDNARDDIVKVLLDSGAQVIICHVDIGLPVHDKLFMNGESGLFYF